MMRRWSNWSLALLAPVILAWLLPVRVAAAPQQSAGGDGLSPRRLAAAAVQSTWPAVYRIATSDPVVFVTIDDGTTRTSSAYDEIRRRGWPVTNFLLPDRLGVDPNYFSTIGSPSAFGTHTVHHPDLTALSYADQRAEICGGRDAVKGIIGSSPGWFRPPYGAWNSSTLQAANDCGFPGFVLWDVTVNDSTIATTYGSIRPGDIILLHYTPTLATSVVTLAAALDRVGLHPAPLSKYLPPTGGIKPVDQHLPGVSAVFSGAGREDVYTRNASGVVVRRTWTSSGGIAGWTNVGGYTIADPDAASPGVGAQPDVFVVGGDSALYQGFSTPQGYGFASLGGTCTSGPSAVYSGAARLDVFCRGSDGQPWTRTWTTASGWSGWSPMGGLINADPDTASAGDPSGLTVFVRGVDNGVWQYTRQGGAWSYQPLGGVCTSGPSAVYSGPARLDVFCRGVDAQLWVRTWRTGTGWSGWSAMGGIATSDPDAASQGGGFTPQVFARGVDGAVWQWYMPADRWIYQSWGAP